MYGRISAITGGEEPISAPKNPIGKPHGVSGAVSKTFIQEVNMDNPKKLGAIIPALISQVKANAQEQPLSNPPSSSAMPLLLMHDERGKAELSILLLQCYDALKVYGKEPEQLKSANAMFQLVLADYPMDKIREAILFYIRHNSGMPDPGDIAQIIMRGGNKPPFKGSVYVRLSQKRQEFPEDLTHEEWEYIKDYEKFIVSGKY
jgi:hypothetical protein